MTDHNVLTQKNINQKLSEFNEVIKDRDVSLANKIDDYSLQKALENLIALYAAKKLSDWDEQHQFNHLSPLASDHKLTQTEAVIFVDQLLKLMDVEIFEMQMWRSMK